jgi:hypothetical protein
MFSQILLVAAVIGLSAPSANMDLALHLLRNLPDVDDTGQFAGADVDLWITPDGTIAECDIPRGVGDEAILSLICPKLLGFRLEPPLAADGTPVHADVSIPIRIFPRGRASLERRLHESLAELRVQAVDQRYVTVGSLQWRTGWRVLVEINEDGVPTSCERATSNVRRNSTDFICSVALDQTYASRNDFSGSPVKYILAIEGLDGSA